MEETITTATRITPDIPGGYIGNGGGTGGGGNSVQSADRYYGSGQNQAGRQTQGGDEANELGPLEEVLVTASRSGNLNGSQPGLFTRILNQLRNFSFGFSTEATFVFPGLSTGGGTFGLNVQYTDKDGLALYGYIPMLLVKLICSNQISKNLSQDLQHYMLRTSHCFLNLTRTEMHWQNRFILPPQNSCYNKVQTVLNVLWMWNGCVSR